MLDRLGGEVADDLCVRRAENLIKLHEVQLASDHASSHGPVANQVRLLLCTAAYWLSLTLRDAIPATSSLSKVEFTAVSAAPLGGSLRSTMPQTTVSSAGRTASCLPARATRQALP